MKYNIMIVINYLNYHTDANNLRKKKMNLIYNVITFEVIK